jgi:hypothetical protein
MSPIDMAMLLRVHFNAVALAMPCARTAFRSGRVSFGGCTLARVIWINLAFPGRGFAVPHCVTTGRMAICAIRSGV